MFGKEMINVKTGHKTAEYVKLIGMLYPELNVSLWQQRGVCSVRLDCL